MAKPFGKLVGDWLVLKQQRNLQKLLQTDMQIPISTLIQQLRVVKVSKALDA